MYVTLLTMMSMVLRSPYQNGAIGLSLDLPEGATVVATSSTPPSCMISSGNPSNIWHLRLERGINPAAKNAKELLYASGKVDSEAENRVFLENKAMKAGDIDGWWILERINNDAKSTFIGTFAIPTSGEQFILANIRTDEAGWYRNKARLQQMLQTIVPLDPVELISNKLEGLENATTTLTSLSEETLRPLIGFTEWRRIQSKSESGAPDSDIGYAHIQIEGGNIEEVEIRNGQELLIDNGIIVTVRSRLVPNLETGIVNDSYARYWMSWDGKEERWSNRVTRWMDQAKATESETGIRNRPQIGAPKSRLLVLQQDLTADILQAPFKALAKDPWLPRALVWVLGPLLASTDHDSQFVWMAYDNSGGVQRVITRTDQIISTPQSDWSIETHFGEGDVTLWSTFDSSGSLIHQKQKNGGIVIGTTEKVLQSIWEPRDLW